MRKFIVWKEKWNTGITSIDDQHFHFVEILNKAYELNENDFNKIKINEILNDLIEYARIHFSTEEDYFEKTGYPSKNEHLEKHKELLTQVLEFSSKFENVKDVTKNVKDLLNFLKDWLENHLIQMDHEYIPWLKEHGVK